jgi:hypothetical protein
LITKLWSESGSAASYRILADSPEIAYRNRITSAVITKEPSAVTLKALGRKVIGGAEDFPHNVCYQRTGSAA